MKWKDLLISKSRTVELSIEEHDRILDKWKKWSERAVYWAEISGIQSELMSGIGAVLEASINGEMSDEVALYDIQQQYIVASKKLIEYKIANKIPSV